ncbi:MAG: hypothetical protein KF764_13995 [Labilithrix sp.]|nr:hypothetical protein [Labilithrix sp.]
MNAGPVPTPYLDQLARAHGFTLDMLVANRAGQVHPMQRVQGGKKGIGLAVFLFVLALLLLAGGIGGAALFHDDLTPPISDTDMNAVYAMAGGGVVLGLAAVAGGIMTVLRVGQRRGAYQRGALAVLEGPIAKTVIRGRRGAPDVFRYEIGGRRFDFVPHAGWELITYGVRYRVYCVAGDLLSLEPS